MKRKVFSLLIIFFYCVLLSAQENEDKKYLLTNTQNEYGISSIQLLDPYLSQMTYSGAGVTYSHVTRKFLSTENLNLSKQTSFRLSTAIALNPASTSSMLYYGTNYGFGLHYHFRPVNGLVLLGGGVWDFDLASKYIARNVNNPVSVDLASNLNFSGIAIYQIPLRKRTLQVQLTVQIPLVGCMFVPPVGDTYYEMFELENIDGTTHMSSVFNKQGITEKLTVEIPFKTSTWLLGIAYSNLKYSSNDIVYKRTEINFSIGTTFESITFKGRKNKAPNNFISTNK